MEIEANREAPAGAARVGPGRYQWNGGGWFGSVFGGTMWLILGSLTQIQQHSTLAVIWAMCGLIPISVCAWMWTQRDRLLPYPAIRNMILMLWAGATVALASMLKLSPELLVQYGGNKWVLIGCFLMFPMMLIQFALLERGAKPKA